MERRGGIAGNVVGWAPKEEGRNALVRVAGHKKSPRREVLPKLAVVVVELVAV